MIKFFFLDEGKINTIETYENSKVIWVDLFNPSQTEIIETAELLNINPEDMKDCLDNTERTGYNYDLIRKNQLLMFRGIYPFEGENFKKPTYPFGIFITAYNKILTIHSEESYIVDKVILELNKKKIPDLISLILAIIERLFAEIDHLAHILSTRINELQNVFLKSVNSNDIQEAFHMNSYPIFFNTAILGNSNVIKTYFNKNKSIYETNLVLYELIDDIQGEIEQIYKITSIYRDLLSNTLDAYASVINNNIQNIMKVIGSISLIVMIPTLIASYFGMNVRLPGGVVENGDPIVFYWILLISLGLSIGAWVLFRKRHWL